MIQIRISQNDGLAEHHIVCDVCGRPIEDARYGMAAYSRETLEVRHLHKGPCDKAAGHQGPWVELRDHLMYLLNNTGTSGAMVEERKRLEQLE